MVTKECPKKWRFPKLGEAEEKDKDNDFDVDDVDDVEDDDDVDGDVDADVLLAIRHLAEISTSTFSSLAPMHPLS